MSFIVLRPEVDNVSSKAGKRHRRTLPAFVFLGCLTVSGDGVCVECLTRADSVIPASPAMQAQCCRELDPWVHNPLDFVVWYVRAFWRIADKVTCQKADFVRGWGVGTRRLSARLNPTAASTLSNVLVHVSGGEAQTVLSIAGGEVSTIWLVPRLSLEVTLQRSPPRLFTPRAVLHHSGFAHELGDDTLAGTVPPDAQLSGGAPSCSSMGGGPPPQRGRIVDPTFDEPGGGEDQALIG